MITESSKVVCKSCGELKTRYLDGRYPSAKDKKWVDENGVQWNGRCCSVCHKAKVAERKRNKHLVKIRKVI